MKKILALLTLLFAVVYHASAVPAYPHPVDYQLPDGSTVRVQVYGDEFFSYMLTSDGYQVTTLADGYLYYYTDGVATRTAQAMRATNPNNRSAAERRYVNSLSSGVDQTYLNAGRAFAEERRATMKVNKEGEFAPFLSQKAKNVATRALAARSLVILCQYQDVKFQASSNKTAFENLLNQKGYNKNGAIGSARDYFVDNSFGDYSPTFDVSPIVTLSQNMFYYGEETKTANDIRPREMIREACQLAADAGVDFSKYDYNDDGQVDNVFVFYAGHNQAEGGSANSIWPHRWVLNPGGSDLRITLNGKIVDDYACTSELKGASGATLCGIGTFTHEFGHVLGLPDFYDTDYQANGLTVGLYDISVMSSGAYNEGGNIPVHYIGLERSMVGWGVMKNLKDAPDNLTIYPVHTKEGTDVWKIETSVTGEYFYLEARQSTAWDRPLSSQGLLIYHIDRSKNAISGMTAERRWQNNTLNAYLIHPCARIIESVGSTVIDGAHSQMFYPGSNNTTSFLPDNSKFRDWAGVPLPIGLSGISQSNGVVTLRVVKKLDLTSVEGKVVDEAGAPVSGVAVIVAEVVPTSVSSVLRLVSPSASAPARAAGVTYTTNTDGAGRYIIPNVPYGTYSVMFERQNYDSQIQTIEANTSSTVINVTLKRFVPELLAQVRWSKSDVDNYLDMSQSIWVASKWFAGDLTAIAGKKIGAVSLETGALTTYEARLEVNGEVKYTSKGSTVAGGRTIVYLPSGMDLTLAANDAVTIEFKLESATKSVGVDKGPAVKGKGDFYSTDGRTWKSLKDNGFDVNVMISLLYKKESDIPETPSVTATPSQRQCLLNFSTVDGNISNWALRYKASGESWKEVADIKTASYLLSGLTPKTVYDAELRAIFGAKKSEPKTFQFTTTDLSSEFSGIAGVKGRYTVGESYTMSCVNLQGETQTIEWRWNGTTLRGESIKFAVGGKGRLDCIITYKDGRVEMLSREIVIH